MEGATEGTDVGDGDTNTEIKEDCKIQFSSDIGFIGILWWAIHTSQQSSSAYLVRKSRCIVHHI